MTIVYMETLLTISVYCCKLIFNFGRRIFIETKKCVVSIYVSSFTCIMSCCKRENSEPKTVDLCRSCLRYKNKIEDLKRALDQFSEENEKLHNEKDKLLKQNADIKERSAELTSSMANVLETRGALENVNDDYSNTKLSKKFQKLYDNKWTKLSEWFDENHSDLKELDRVNALSVLMKNAYKECLELADNQLRSFLFLENDEEIPTSREELPALLKIRRVNGQTESTRNSITKKIISRVLNEVNTRVLMPGENGKGARKELEEFFCEYIDMCWLMTISHPRLLLVFDIIGQPYIGAIKDRFQQYSTQETVESTDFKKGSVYEVVWPCVMLEDESGVYSKGDVITVDVYSQSQ